MQFNLKTQKPKEQNRTIENVFGDQDDSDEEEEQKALPSHAKKSNNIGMNTITSQGPNSFGKHRNLGFTNDNSFRPWATDIELKHHKLSRPISEKINDKLKEENEAKLQKLKEEQMEKQMIEQKQQEFQKIKERIKNEKNKIKICEVCKRKFANLEQLNTHEQKSQLHQENLRKQTMIN